MFAAVLFLSFVEERHLKNYITCLCARWGSNTVPCTCQVSNTALIVSSWLWIKVGLLLFRFQGASLKTHVSYVES
jgi:hypothetical protein